MGPARRAEDEAECARTLRECTRFDALGGGRAEGRISVQNDLLVRCTVVLRVNFVLHRVTAHAHARVYVKPLIE